MGAMRSSRFFTQHGRPAWARVLLAALGLVVVVFYFFRRIWVSMRLGGWIDSVDMPAYQWALGHQNPVLQGASTALFYWGSTPGMVITLLLIALLLCWYARSWWPLAVIAFTAAVSTSLTSILKAVLEVPRPHGVPGGPEPPASFSMPSGHTLNAAALVGIAVYLAVMYGLRRYAWLMGTIAALFVAAMGASRIYLGHHWVSDVVMGLCIGLAWGAVVAILHYCFVPAGSRRAIR